MKASKRIHHAIRGTRRGVGGGNELKASAVCRLDNEPGKIHGQS
jgi:hypothetical protein